VDALLSAKLEGLKSGKGPEVKNLLSAMGHTLESGGKRLRPLLALAAARTLGADEAVALPGALAVELIHTYSLIHDDLPALDDDPVRRGKPSCHVAYGEATAILAGDALQSLAFETLAADSTAGPERTLAAVALLARAVGPLGMAGGQAEDLAFERRSPTLSGRDSMAAKKTGELIAASLSVGAALAGADNDTISIFREAGLLSGQAFQIQDDLLNQEGDPRLLGKAVGTDQARGKASILNYLGPGRARAKARSLGTQAKKLLAPFRPDVLIGLLDSLIDRES
jgi:geranylgeranyl pyrophosphate synthase